MVRQNGITIEDIMNMEVMENCKIIAGYKGIRNTISKVNIMADPDILDWVDEGELLLTTGYAFKKADISEQKKLIKECASKNLAGIGIKISPHLETIPKEILDLADGLNFPIIDIYYDIPFSDIMTPIFQEIFNKQAKLLKKVERVHEEFMNAMLLGSSVSKIGQIIYENIKNPILIELQWPNKTIPQFGEIDEDTKDILLNDSKKFADPKFKRQLERKFSEDKFLINGKYITRMVMPIVVRNNVYGHIFAWAVNTPLGGFDLSVIERASTTMALEILKKLSIKEVENRYRTEFLEDLLSYDDSKKQKAIRRAHLFNLSNNDKYMVVVFELKYKKYNSKKDEMPVDYIQENLQKVIYTTETILDGIGIKNIVASRTDSIHILLALRKGQEHSDILDKLNNKIKSSLDDKFKDIDFRIGIGRPYDGLENVYNSFMDANRAIKAGKIISEGEVIDFEKLGIYKILCQDHLKEELIRFYNGTLKSLVDYDNKKSTELVKTLESYFFNNGNLKKMSEELYTHYNTVLYRVQRINEITGMSLENSDNRLNLEIALKIKKLLD
ncbi:PucR family transcriptional regulator [Dethiothermospora halolimnae]|uniref:PucR family transcriptional regulator n=1 Tax=Dethiothermospora halolimnae TaxID=3114390 RepID=UPI003CCC090C